MLHSLIDFIQRNWGMLLFVVLLGLAVIVLFFVFVLRKGSGSSLWQAWRAYVLGQGLVLFTYLLIGIALAGIGSYFGPLIGKVETGGKLIEYRHVDLTKGPVVKEYQDVANFSHMTVFTKTITPDNSMAMVTILGVPRIGTGPDAKRIESSSTWSRWDQQSNYSGIRVVAEPAAQAGATGASQVDILVYVDP